MLPEILVCPASPPVSGTKEGAEFSHLSWLVWWCMRSGRVHVPCSGCVRPGQAHVPRDPAHAPGLQGGSPPRKAMVKRGGMFGVPESYFYLRIHTKKASGTHSTNSIFATTFSSDFCSFLVFLFIKITMLFFVLWCTCACCLRFFSKHFVMACSHVKRRFTRGLSTF